MPPSGTSRARSCAQALAGSSESHAGRRSRCTASSASGPPGRAEAAPRSPASPRARASTRREQRSPTAARDWLLGRNQWGASFVVGHGPTAARHPHHWASLDGPGRPVGAVVGGPTTRAIIREQRSGFRFRSRSPFNGRIVYEDNVENYVTSEVSLDYTAGALLNLAVAAP